VHCGYLHRGFEKECESHTWHNLIPYVDRLNYCSALINNFAYCEAVEKLMGIEITPRCRYLRTLLSEYSRIADHLTCVAAALMELGAMTAFLYLVTIRDYIYEHIADLTAARAVTYTYGRIGGLARDLPDGWLAAARADPRPDGHVRRPRARTGRPQSHLHRPHARRRRAAHGRSDQLGVHGADPALDRGPHATCARTRRTSPTRNSTSRCPVGIKGDNYDRYYVRMRELDESPACDPPDRRPAAGRPDQRRRPRAARCRRSISSTTEIESLINHFKLIMEGPQSAGRRRVYSAHEGANGELGFYLVSVGGERAVEGSHVRRPELRAHGRRASHAPTATSSPTSCRPSAP
jgi:NADH-quinone oxidoreductase subunit D